MCTIDGENLELLTLDASNPARNVGGVTVPGRSDGILVFGQACLALGKLIELAQ
jgi:hypothetical protein